MEVSNYIIKEITPLSENDCIYVADRRINAFTYPLHSHPEYELNFVEYGNGIRRTVGDSSEIIDTFDLVLIANKELAHSWEGSSNLSNTREITIQFTSEIFSDNLVNKNQFKTIKNMLEKAQCGILFPTESVLKVYHLLDKLANDKHQGFYTILDFLTILHELSLYENVKILSSSSFAKTDNINESRRIMKIRNYIIEHYKEEIRLNDVSDMVAMTPTAFSKFFSLHTGKSMSDYIIDIRLGFAARMLVETTRSISEIGYECGFNNLSNFNRLFKKKKSSITSATPIFWH